MSSGKQIQETKDKKPRVTQPTKASVQSLGLQTQPLYPAEALHRAMSTPASILRPADLLTLQQTGGNKAVRRMLEQRAKPIPDIKPANQFPMKNGGGVIQRVKYRKQRRMVPTNLTETVDPGQKRDYIMKLVNGIRDAYLKKDDLTLSVAARQKQTERYIRNRTLAERMEVDVQPDGTLTPAQQLAINNRVVIYDTTQAQQAQTKVTVNANQLLRSDGTPADTTNSATAHSLLGWEIYVMKGNGELHMSGHKIGLRHHSSLLNAADVACGGEIKTDASGKILEISNKTGHYLATPAHFRQVLHQLKKQGYADPLQGFDVKGFGITQGPVQDFLANLPVDETYEVEKTDEVENYFIETYGIVEVQNRFLAHGWSRVAGQWIDYRGQVATPKAIRKALKDFFGKKGGSHLTQRPDYGQHTKDVDLGYV